MIPGKLRASPNFSLNFAVDGACFATGEVEPYPQYWLSEKERMVFATFGRRGGLAVDQGLDMLLRLIDPANPARARKALQATIGQMASAGLLIAPDAELSRYDRSMARDYLDHRPFPTALADRIAALGGRGRVLDLAAGPGSLALELAARGADVTIMELSRGFVAAARAEARARKVSLEAIHESCNRLVQHDGQYDAITISQALHWLDDVALCRGVVRCLAPGGSFFVVHGALTLSDDHPLSYLLGDRTPLGDKQPMPFADEARALFRRTGRLFEALDTPGVVRHEHAGPQAAREPVVPARIELFRQVRPIDEGFARAFLSPAHIAALGVEPQSFWQDLSQRCRAADPAHLMGVQQWALLQFSRGAASIDPEHCAIPAEAEIAYP